MPDDLYGMLLMSNVPSNVMYLMVEHYHFGMEAAKYDWEICLEQYVKSLGGIFSQALAEVLTSFVSRKSGCENKDTEKPKFMTEAIEGIVSFGNTAASGNFGRRFPDKAAYRLQPKEQENSVAVYDVVYIDADTGDVCTVGTLRTTAASLRGVKRECHTRGKLGTRFWWVNGDKNVRYYLFTTQGVCGEAARAYYDKCLAELGKHYQK